MAESKREYRYIQFPLCLLQLTYIEPVEGFKMIYWYTVLNSVKNEGYNNIVVCRHLMNAYNELDDNIPTKLKELITQYFPDNILNENDLLQVWKSDEKFKDTAIIWYKITHYWRPETLKKWNINILFDEYYKAVKHIESFEKNYGKDAEVNVKQEMLAEFINSANRFDSFRAYLGIKSKIGLKKFVKINKPDILGRMIGCKSTAAFEHYKTNKYLMPTVEKYSKRCHMDKLLKDLIKSGFIMYFSNQGWRYIYLSTYMEPEKLKKLIEKSNTKINIENRRKAVSASLFSKDYNKLTAEVVSNEFIRPTVEEVEEYCKENNYKINPETFVDYYDSRGWYAGKSKIKDWKATVRTWNKNQYLQSKPDNPAVRIKYPNIT